MEDQMEKEMPRNLRIKEFSSYFFFSRHYSCVEDYIEKAHEGTKFLRHENNIVFSDPVIQERSKFSCFNITPEASAICYRRGTFLIKRS